MFIFTIMQLTILRCVWSISSKPILIIVSYDGFRYNHIEKDVTPNMIKLRQEGSYVDYMYSVFPTKTFPNHFTIVTGLYTETHGVIGNKFYDPKLQKVIGIKDDIFTQNDKVVPIWTLNELAGKDRYSGVMMWPGGEFKFQNISATYHQEWSRSYDIFQRVDMVMKWITDPEKPANLVCLYVEEPDFYSHIYGPSSAKVTERLRVLDNLTLYIDDQLQQYGLKDKATVIHLSDHGMGSIRHGNIINLDNILTPNTYSFTDTSPTLHLRANAGYEESVYTKLKAASEKLKTFEVYRKDELLPRWHFKNNIRTPPILLLAKEQYGFQDLEAFFNTYKERSNMTITEDTEVGLHGFDPKLPNMRAFFMIRGPRVKKNNLIKPFDNIELYNLFANILDIKPEPNNGTIPLADEVFIVSKIDENVDNTLMSLLVVAVGGVVLSLLLISCAAAITILLIKRQQNMTTTAALNKRFPQTFQQSIEAQHLLETEEA